MVFAVDVKDPKERVQAYLDSYKNDPQTETFDAALMKHHLKLLSATATPKVTATFRMKVTRDFCSTMGNMHGGAIALVLDMCTTTCMAPVSTPDFWLFGGVSRTLNTTFLRAIRQGTEIEVFCEVLHVGARLGKIVSSCFVSATDGL
ncbi:hypothetical protein ASPVEDRAFT_39714 [Aspergillus versicolor CBS 583.65]|uniref:Thioesterase domain-containing protein n=1 Tax=Aspergillus versicolor CBS 583.65 TaxID=1036611 RepID=A0A1L9PFI5_ASPVE|nr:uncharacterized protein ASPVEDRAFT_39714 [Aspergillus versicolor CBS 583.65]OJJ00278.1 hypothetical protein ASPVEDRAFT_39714 [Aspergillus versicolor CBS 583.65]